MNGRAERLAHTPNYSRASYNINLHSHMYLAIIYMYVIHGKSCPSSLMTERMISLPKGNIYQYLGSEFKCGFFFLLPSVFTFFIVLVLRRDQVLERSQFLRNYLPAFFFQAW